MILFIFLSCMSNKNLKLLSDEDSVVGYLQLYPKRKPTCPISLMVFVFLHFAHKGKQKEVKAFVMPPDS